MNRGVLAFLFLSVSGFAAAQAPLSLKEALREAHAANAKLPLPAYDVAIAREKRNEARAERWLKVAVEGDFIYAPPSGYDPVVTNLGEFKLQAVGRQPIYDGGARRAAVARAQAELEAASARYRLEEKDLDLEVASRFAEFLAAEAEIVARREGIDRLRNYRTLLDSRRASGQGVSGDLLKADVRGALEEANVLGAEKKLEEARLELNNLMGREPTSALQLSSSPLPDVPEPIAAGLWEGAPEIAEASAQTRSAGAQLDAARAERRPHLDLSADVGFWGSDTSRLVPLDLRAANPDATFADRIRRDLGYSVTLSFSWPIFDFGAIRARVAQAELTLRKATQNLEVQKREARLQWEKTQATLRNVTNEIQILSRAAPDARDSYLATESRYRGGTATALEVLDAYAAAVDAQVRLADAISRYRIARALLTRWGSP